MHYQYLACVAGVKRGRGRGNLGAREDVGRSLLPLAWSRALIPFPFPFERLPRRLAKLGKGMWSSVEQAFVGRDKNELS